MSPKTWKTMKHDIIWLKIERCSKLLSFSLDWNVASCIETDQGKRLEDQLNAFRKECLDTMSKAWVSEYTSKASLGSLLLILLLLELSPWTVEMDEMRHCDRGCRIRMKDHLCVCACQIWWNVIHCHRMSWVDVQGILFCWFWQAASKKIPL